MKITKEKSLCLYGCKMNVNIFFVLLSIGLLMIFTLFKPLDIHQKKFKDIPLYEITNFTLFELENETLATLTNGTNAVRYADRYEISDVDFSDSSQKHSINIKANKAHYKGDVISLLGDVVYTRDDGLIFKTKKATYNKKTTIAHTNTDYISYRGEDQVKGSLLIYNNTSGKSKSKNVRAKYQLQER